MKMVAGFAIMGLTIFLILISPRVKSKLFSAKKEMVRRSLIRKLKNLRQQFYYSLEKPTINMGGCNSFTWEHCVIITKECLASLGLIQVGTLLEITARQKIFQNFSTHLTVIINLPKQSCTTLIRQTMRSLPV